MYLNITMEFYGVLNFFNFQILRLHGSAKHRQILFSSFGEVGAYIYSINLSYEVLGKYF